MSEPEKAKTEKLKRYKTRGVIADSDPVDMYIADEADKVIEKYRKDMGKQIDKTRLYHDQMRIYEAQLKEKDEEIETVVERWKIEEKALNEEIRLITNKYDELRKQNERLRKALEFYADEMAYLFPKDAHGYFRSADHEIPVMKDGGKRATKALSKEGDDES